MNAKVDVYFDGLKKWQVELHELRNIILECGLTEELKWNSPCYMYQKHNIAIIQGFKEYCALLFFKGVFLNDAHGILTKTGENTQVGRQIRFTKLDDIKKNKLFIKQYLFEAIEVEKAGLKITDVEKERIEFPEELTIKLKEIPELKKAFEKLTPGRQRAYIYHFSNAKQSKTRETRIEKYINKIINGFGLNDCTCGLSKHMPNCDGSHKYINKTI
jgi:uncharacterized protein YdeI (YjbR/CyaY-like superfamily)